MEQKYIQQYMTIKETPHILKLEYKVNTKDLTTKIDYDKLESKYNNNDDNNDNNIYITNNDIDTAYSLVNNIINKFKIYYNGQNRKLNDYIIDSINKKYIKNNISNNDITVSKIKENDTSSIRIPENRLPDLINFIHYYDSENIQTRKLNQESKFEKLYINQAVPLFDNDYMVNNNGSNFQQKTENIISTSTISGYNIISEIHPTYYVHGADDSTKIYAIIRNIPVVYERTHIASSLYFFRIPEYITKQYSEIEKSVRMVRIEGNGNTIYTSNVKFSSIETYNSNLYNLNIINK